MGLFRHFTRWTIAIMNVTVLIGPLVNVACEYHPCRRNGNHYEDHKCVFANHQNPYLTPARNIFDGEPKPIKALSDNVLEHGLATKIVTTVTIRLVIWFT
jgi:hypothetical protein